VAAGSAVEAASADWAAMVGDRDCDLGSARNAGIKTAHLVCAAVPENLNCDWRLVDFKQMLEML
jgi:phosphoglycolate phosphatase-like HAD superfamily hydrolase